MSVEQLFNVAASSLAFVACMGFVTVYHLRVTWWRTEVGRNLMALAAALAALFLYTVLVSVWPDGCLAMVLRWVRGVLALVVTVVMVQRARIFLRAQREYRRPSGV